ncbi:MAG TPA: S8 family peptidase [Oscillospiraceae bacterium]|nr:S8 family peptidase [Oscillospiraceae bacterium]HXK77356.1 S8 family peptidase [Oscillospiraceae bacterium]
MAIEIDENTLTLDEFVKLPTTVDFQALNTERFKDYVKVRPYLHPGTELANHYIVIYLNQKYIQSVFEDLGKDFSSFYPKILSPLDSTSNDAAGISKVQNQPFLNLSGRGVILGFIDTGIDYTQNAFKFEDGNTKILNIWDQTVDGPRSDNIYFGSLYDADMINLALKSDDPYGVVPSIDEDGHGTFLASVAASNETGTYIGAAPKANIVAVKLRRAKEYYINRYLLPADNPNLYESTDYLLGIKYVMDRALALDMPAVICIGMGSNSSARDGNTLFEEYISYISQWPGYTFITAAGNESNAKHHTQGKILQTGNIDVVSIKVGKQDTSFSVLIFGDAFDKISVGITSPTGEVLPRVSFKPGLEYSEKLLLENTTLYVKYSKDTSNEVIVGLRNATEGIWDITLFGDAIVNGEYFAWLPITGQVSDMVEFLKPVPEYTVVFPSSALRSITCGAYDTDDNSLYVASSWGPTRLPRMAPDFVAPGVNVRGIYPTGYGTMSGTSVAAAMTSGAAALLMEWGIVQGNIPAMDGDLVKSLLIGGCVREEHMQYPNIKWGYGKMNLFNTFSSLKETIL